MSYSMADELFQSRTRSAVLELLFVRKLHCSMSELARRANVTPRAVGSEVRRLQKAGLVFVEAIGSADLVRGNLKHPSARAICVLVKTPVQSGDVSSGRALRESLVFWGAPLGNVKGKQHVTLCEALLAGLEAARTDGTVLRVLPTMLAKHLDDVDWVELKEQARRRKLKAEVGWLIELTVRLTGRNELIAHADVLRDARRHAFHFFPSVRSSFEEELVRKKTSKTAASWGFWMNISDDSFKSLMDRHA